MAWDLSSPNQDQTHTQLRWKQSLNYWTLLKSLPDFFSFLLFSSMQPQTILHVFLFGWKRPLCGSRISPPFLQILLLKIPILRRTTLPPHPPAPPPSLPPSLIPFWGTQCVLRKLFWAPCFSPRYPGQFIYVRDPFYHLNAGDA